MTNRSYIDWPARHELMIELNSLPVAVSTGNEEHAMVLCRRIEELVRRGLQFVHNAHPVEPEIDGSAEPETSAQADRDEPADQPGDDDGGDDDDDDDDAPAELRYLTLLEPKTMNYPYLGTRRRDS